MRAAGFPGRVNLNSGWPLLRFADGKPHHIEHDREHDRSITRPASRDRHHETGILAIRSSMIAADRDRHQIARNGDYNRL